MVGRAFNDNQVKRVPEQAQWKANLTILKVYFRERAF